MLTLANEEYTNDYSIYSAVPERIRQYVQNIGTDRLMEIRIRSGAPVSLIRTDGTFWINGNGKISPHCNSAITASGRDIQRGLELITHSSVYAFENEIRNGYVTLAGGHRVGICGDAVIENGRISHLRMVQALNYRYAREVIGAADEIFGRIYDGKKIYSTIIVSPPMYGKTTMLRDIARQLALAGKRVSIVDERGEIAALSGGVSPFDLGAGCDVLSNVNKAEGMLLMLRSMSPDVIITDEIGGSADFDAVREIKKRGVSVITSLHGTDAASGEFERVIRLGGVGMCLN